MYKKLRNTFVVSYLDFQGKHEILIFREYLIQGIRLDRQCKNDICDFLIFFYSLAIISESN